MHLVDQFKQYNSRSAQLRYWIKCQYAQIRALLMDLCIWVLGAIFVLKQAAFLSPCYCLVYKYSDVHEMFLSWTVGPTDSPWHLGVYLPNKSKNNLICHVATSKPKHVLIMIMVLCSLHS